MVLPNRQMPIAPDQGSQHRKGAEADRGCLQAELRRRIRQQEALARHGERALAERDLARLLADNGYKGERTAALAKFRARMKLPKDANTDALFDALETDAMKQSAPAGYSICNDSAGAIWAALGVKAPNGWLARGWWKVMPGACAHAITDPLSAEIVYLHAEGHGDHHLVTGKTQFCVTDITFEVSGKGDCAEQGLTATGFAATDTKGHIGYSAHIGQNGLLPPMARK